MKPINKLSFVCYNYYTVQFGIPKDKVEAIAEMILPDIVAFFQTEEGKKVFEEWKKEQEEKQKKEGVET